MNIVLDAMGGDDAPLATLDGAALALAAYPDIQTLFLTGDEATLRREVDRVELPAGRIEIVHAPEVVAMDEAATVALRSKKQSSITVGADLVKQGAAQALVSAGNTGAAVAASTVKMRNLAGVERAGICSPMPTSHGCVHLIDAGANPEAKAEHLLQYGIMASVYCRHVLGVENPVVGLMSVGSEDHKGTDFTKEVFALLKSSDLNFRGNVEGHDLFETPLDVVVCDGFVGNVILKSCEATAKVLFRWIKEEIMGGPITYRLGAKMAQGAFLKVRERGNYENYGGSPLLGVNGISIIAHGSSTPEAIKNAIRVARDSIRHEVNPHIEEEIQKFKTTHAS